MRPLHELTRKSPLLRGVALEVLRLDGSARWYPLRPPKKPSAKWRPRGPIELSPGPQSLVFWSSSEVLLRKDVVVPECGWVVTSFWERYSADEPDQHFPACRVYVGDLVAYLHDPEARY